MTPTGMLRPYDPEEGRRIGQESRDLFISWQEEMEKRRGKEDTKMFNDWIEIKQRWGLK